MYKVTKAIEKEIKVLATKLPPTFYDANVKKVVTGEVLEKMQNVDVDGPVDPKKVYTITASKNYPVSHKNRMLTAFKNGGVPAIRAYVDGIKELFNDSHTPITVANVPQL